MTSRELFPADDRGLNYGDGLFETMRCVDGSIPLLDHHLDRLMAGCRSIRLDGVGRQDAQRAAATAARDAGEGIVKLIVTRGSGGRGYRPPRDCAPRLHASTHPLPEFPDDNYTRGVDVAICRTRIGISPDTAGLKHLGRLEQVLASAELTDEFAEGLMLDETGAVVEGTRSNLFIGEDDVLVTPRLDRAGVAGVMRSVVMQEATNAGITMKVEDIDSARLARAGEIFLTNSVFGIWPVRSIPAVDWQGSRGAVAARLMKRIAGFGVAAWAA